ncbi:MAG: sugar ABC transporter substrate-binding protein [Oscillospiraceae bacterium]
MKKLVATLLAAFLLSSSLAACSAQGGGSSAPAAINRDEYQTTESGGEYPSATELPSYKIGVLLWGYTDVLGASVKRNLEYVGKEFNCEMVFAEGGTGGAEAYVSATENLIQAGCDGIVSLTAYAGQIEACDKAGVYLGIMLNEIADDQTRQQAAASDYFVGMVTENDEECGRMMVQDLYEQGCRNIVYIAPAPGIANHDNRVRGIEAAVEEYDDLTLITNYRGSEQAEALQSFALS